MKKKFAFIVGIVLITLCMHCALAEDGNPPLSEEDWLYIGYTYGGVTFAVPKDYSHWDISPSYAAQGYVLMGGNENFTLQMRVFQPDELCYDDFKAMINQESSAQVSTRIDDDSEILIYRNTEPNAYSELFGVALTGLDGLFYKISIFTGDDGAFEESAPVWEIAEVIGQTVRHQDFSEWGVEGAPDFSTK